MKRLEFNLENKLEKMTLEEKLGQLMMVGFSGSDFTPELQEMIRKYKVGGLIYFARNIENPAQVAKLSRRIQRESLASNQILALISADEEGGVVTRVKGMTHFPGLMALGAADSLDLAYETGLSASSQLKYLGVNVNLAPVLDVNNKPANPVIGVWSFGLNPNKVSNLVAEGNQVAAIVSQEAITLIQDPEARLGEIQKLLQHKRAGVHLFNCRVDVTRPVETMISKTNPDIGMLLKEKLSQNGITVKVDTNLSKVIDKDKLPDGEVVIVLTRDIVKNKSQRDLIDALVQQGVKPIIISQRNPYEAKTLPDLTVMTTYDYSPVHAEPLAKILTGREQPKGTLPVKIQEV